MMQKHVCTSVPDRAYAGSCPDVSFPNITNPEAYAVSARLTRLDDALHVFSPKRSIFCIIYLDTRRSTPYRMWGIE